MAANQVDFKILPSDQFSVYSPATRSDKVITYFTLLSKLRGDILSVGQDDDPNNIVSAFYSSVGGTQTLHLVKADGSEVTASVAEPTVGTVTSVNLTAGTAISVSGGPITTSGSITVTNTAPDQVVVLTGAGTTSISGTYPSFTITSNDQFVGTVTSVATTAPITGGTITATGTIGITQSGVATDGYLSSTDWNTFNSKEPTLTKGNLTEATSSVLTITGGTGAVIGSGTTIQVSQAGASASGFLSSADWTTFNGKQGALTFSAPLVNTSGTVSIPAATGLVDGYLSAANFVTFNGKQNAITLTTTGATGAATLIGATLNIPNYADQFVGTVTSVDMSVPTGFAISGNPITISGTLAVAFAAGYSLPTNASQTTWDTAYNDSITAFAYNTSNGVLTLTQQDAGTLTATVTLQPFSTTNLTEGTNLYYTDTRSRLALSAGTGITYDSATGVITNSSTSSGGTVTSVAALTIGTTGTDLSSSVVNSTTTPVITLQVPTASAANRGALSSTDWSTFNSKQPQLNGTGFVKASGTTISYDNSTYYLASNPSGFTSNTGTVTSVNLTAGTRIEVAGGPVITSGSITVTHGVAAGADFTSAQAFESRVVADGGIFEALGEVAIAIGSLEDAASPSSTDFNDGVVIQNVAIDEFGHLLGVGATDLDERYVQNLTAGTGITVSGSPSSTAGLITVTNSDRGSSQNIFKNIAVSGQTTIAADTNDDTLTVVAGSGISLTTNDSTDTLTITNTSIYSIPIFAAYSNVSLSLTPANTELACEFTVQSALSASFFSHSTTVNPNIITLLSSGIYEISFGYGASNGNNQIASVSATVAVNGVGLYEPFSFTQLDKATFGMSASSFVNTYIYGLAANDEIEIYFTADYVGGSTGTITINPSGFDGSTYITIKKIG